MQNTAILRWVITGSFTICSVLGIFLSLPLWRGKIGPNSVSGFRTAKTLADPALWFAVNQSVGRTMTIISVAMLVLTVVFHFTLTRNRPSFAALVLTVCFIAGTSAAAIQGIMMTRSS